MTHQGLSLANPEQQDPQTAMAAGPTSQGARAAGADFPRASCGRDLEEEDPGTSSICWQAATAEHPGRGASAARTAQLREEGVQNWTRRLQPLLFLLLSVARMLGGDNARD